MSKSSRCKRKEKLAIERELDEREKWTGEGQLSKWRVRTSFDNGSSPFGKELQRENLGAVLLVLLIFRLVSLPTFLIVVSFFLPLLVALTKLEQLVIVFCQVLVKFWLFLLQFFQILLMLLLTVLVPVLVIIFVLILICLIFLLLLLIPTFFIFPI